MSGFTDMMIDDGFTDPQDYMYYLERLAYEMFEEREPDYYEGPDEFEMDFEEDYREMYDDDFFDDDDDDFFDEDDLLDEESNNSLTDDKEKKELLPGDIEKYGFNIEDGEGSDESVDMKNKTENMHDNMMDYKIPLKAIVQTYMKMEIKEPLCYRIDKEPGEDEFYVKIKNITTQEEIKIKVGKFRGAYKNTYYFTVKNLLVWVMEIKINAIILSLVELPDEDLAKFILF